MRLFDRLWEAGKQWEEAGFGYTVGVFKSIDVFLSQKSSRICMFLL